MPAYTVGQVVVNALLPKEMRDYNRVMDKKSISKLFDKLARTYPDRYREILYDMTRIGAIEAQRSNIIGPGLSDLVHYEYSNKIKDEIRKRLRQLFQKGLKGEQLKQEVLNLLSEYNDRTVEELNNYLASKNNAFYHQVQGGIRGNKFQLRSLLLGDLTYIDNNNQPIPVAILRSWSEGMTPMEYMASSYGMRKTFIDKKLSTADAGEIAKHLMQSAHRLIVLDNDYKPEERPKYTRGIIVDINDEDNVGAILAAPVDKYPANTILTQEIIADLKNKGVKELIVRSPIASSHRTYGGLYAMDLGLREGGRLPQIGEMVGINAAAAIGEPISQAQLCLAYGTLVRMADGRLKPIQNIVPGEMVWGVGLDGSARHAQVLEVHDNGDRDCFLYVFRDQNTVKCVSGEPYSVICTPDHKVVKVVVDNQGVHYQKVPIGNITSSDIVLSASFDNNGQTVILQHRLKLYDSRPFGRIRTYDLTIDHPDHLFIIYAGGLVVSNSAIHGGGVFSGKKALTMDDLKRILDVPKSGYGFALHSRKEGTVEDIVQTTDGGYEVIINGERHYVPPQTKIIVQKGQYVEAGDPITEGIENPAEIVNYKGLGEGRRRYIDILRNMLKAMGMPAHRRNIEVLVTGLMNYVEIDDIYDDYAPGDLVPYNIIERKWKPRGDAIEVDVNNLKPGVYLEIPVLHYTIGTPVTKSVIETLKRSGIKKVTVNKKPPPFRGVYIPSEVVLSKDPEWFTRFLGAYQRRSILEAAREYSTSDLENTTSFVAPLAYGKTFGLTGMFKDRGSIEKATAKDYEKPDLSGSMTGFLKILG
jgi:DNA-directed RNA polymerase subunit beta'